MNRRKREAFAMQTAHGGLLGAQPLEVLPDPKLYTWFLLELLLFLAAVLMPLPGTVASLIVLLTFT